MSPSSGAGKSSGMIVISSSSDTIPLDEGDIFSSKTRMAEPMRARSIALRTCARAEGSA